MQTKHKIALSLAVATLFAATPAMAHPGLPNTHDVVTGFMHPLSGMDHLLAMLAVGLLAAQMGGRALWAVPLSFVGMMVAGSLLAMSGIQVPAIEAGIALSVIVLGAAVALSLRVPTGFAMALTGLFAVFHGAAHAAEMPADASGLTYAAGFILATAALHATGLALGVSLKRFSDSRAARLGGAAIAAAGAGLLAGWL